MKTTIPFLDLPAQHRRLRKEIQEQWQKLVNNASFIGGEAVSLFEEEFAAACGVKHCVAVSNGTDALRLIFTALDVGPDDEIITVPNTFIATTEAISQAGATPIFVDVDPETYTLNPAQLDDAITKRTVGIVPVHLYGQTADMDTINAIAKKHNLWVIEDSCQAHLARYKDRLAGGLAKAAAFSFYPGKNLGACGDAGAVTTNDSVLAARIRILRDHGQSKKYCHDVEGFNNRCDALQAAALRIKLPYLAQWNEKRRFYAELYQEILKETPLVLPVNAPSCLHSYHLFVVLSDERDRLFQELSEHGIQTGLHYPVPLHLQKAYNYLGLLPGSFPVAEHCADRLLSLPLYPEMTEKQIRYVGSILQKLTR